MVENRSKPGSPRKLSVIMSAPRGYSSINVFVRVNVRVSADELRAVLEKLGYRVTSAIKFGSIGKNRKAAGIVLEQRDGKDIFSEKIILAGSAVAFERYNSDRSIHQIQGVHKKVSPPRKTQNFPQPLRTNIGMVPSVHEALKRMRKWVIDENKGWISWVTITNWCRKTYGVSAAVVFGKVDPMMLFAENYGWDCEREVDSQSPSPFNILVKAI